MQTAIFASDKVLELGNRTAPRFFRPEHRGMGASLELVCLTTHGSGHAVVDLPRDVAVDVANTNIAVAAVSVSAAMLPTVIGGYGNCC